MVGLTYEGKPNDDWDNARYCVSHRALEMFHTCAGGPGEPLGYCAAWPGDYIEREIVWMGKPRIHKDPTCVFED